MKRIHLNPPFLPNKIGKKYYNFIPGSNGPERPHKWFLPSLKMYIHSYLYRQKTVPNFKKWVVPYEANQTSTEPIITWLGHATVLIQIDNFTIITDPIIASPSHLHKRVLPFGASLSDLPKIDIVLLSHNHWDHMDAPTLRLLYENYDPLFLVPEGNKTWFLERSMNKVEEFSWWQSWIQNGVEFSFVPAWHWSQRSLFDRNQSLWGGWVIKGSSNTVFFAGDTAYNELYFKAIGQQFPNIDCAIMPIGPCEPEEHMRKSHMNAEQAGQAFLDCNARLFIPMHWGTFYFGIDTFETPFRRFTAWWNRHQAILLEKQWVAGKIGQQIRLWRHKNAYSNMLFLNR